MSHNIEMRSYQEKVKREDVQKEWDNYVRMEDWQEGATGLPNKIRWLDKAPVQENYEAAEQYIEDHDKKWYDCLAVRYYSYPPVSSTKLSDLSNRLNALRKTYHEKDNTIQCKGNKSSFVGCKSCGSHLAIKYIRSNKCPLCGTDLRSDTVMESLRKMKEKISNLEKEITVETKKNQEKLLKKATVRWLVKIEYHT